MLQPSAGKIHAILLATICVAKALDNCSFGATRALADTTSAHVRNLVQLPRGYIFSSQVQATHDGGVGKVKALVYSDESDILFVGGTNQRVQYWTGASIVAQTPSNTLGFDSGGSVSALEYIPGDRAIVVGREDGIMRLVRTSDNTILGDVQENTRASLVTAIEYMSYNDDLQQLKELASASGAGSTIKIWNINSRSLTRTLVGHNRPVLALRFMAKHEMLVSGGFDGLVCFWSMPQVTQIASGKRCVGTKQYLATAYRPSDCLAATLIAGGTYFIYGQPAGTASNACEMELGNCAQLQDAPYTLYRVENPSRWQLSGHTGTVRALEYASDFDLAISGGDDSKVRLWNPTNGQLVSTYDIGGGIIVSMLYILSLSALVVGTGNKLLHFDIVDGSLLKTHNAVTDMLTLSYLGPYQFLATPAGAASTTGVSTVGGTLVDIWHTIEKCIDGQMPSTAASCALCPANLAGKDGTCQIPCASGSSSSPNRTVCVPCQVRTAGINGFCTLCPPGRFQDRIGRLTCNQCRKGYAQPLSGQLSCAPCLDNMVAEVVGQANCVECRDGTQPTSDHTRCVLCPTGMAGKRGLCYQCLDGQQPSSDRSLCIACPSGMAGTGGGCQLCPDGSQPIAALTTCQQCPVGRAGTQGLCAQCGKGQMPEPQRTFCANCPVGQIGSNGTCAPCPNGFVPSTDRTLCIECPNGTAAQLGVCITCVDGSHPAANRSACVQCPRGFAGTNGFCNLCPKGLEASPNQSVCVPCPIGTAAAAGVCSRCYHGFSPNADSSACAACIPGRAGTRGLCAQCADGTQQNSNKSSCENCPDGSAGRGGTCALCTHPKMQHELRTECVLRTLPNYYLFYDAKCSGHKTCRSHFKHEKYEELFCCPTPNGHLLSCCQFESDEQKAAWGAIGAMLDGFVGFCAQTRVVPPVLGILVLLPICAYVYRVATHEDWESFRADISTTRTTLILCCLSAPLWIVVLPWLSLTILVGFWVPLGAIMLYSFAFKRVYSATQYVHYARPLAMRRMKGWLALFFLFNFFMETVLFIHDWMLLHVLMCSIFNIKIGLIKPLAFEQVVALVPMPGFFIQLLGLVIASLRYQQVFVSVIFVHVNIHADFTVTLLVAAGACLTGSFTSYLLLTCDVFGRLGAARQSIMLAYIPGKRKARALFCIGLIDLLAMLFVHYVALSSALMLPLLLQLALDEPGGALGDTPLTRMSVWTYVFFVQAIVVCMWVSICSGNCVDNPPGVLASVIERCTLLRMRGTRLDQFKIRAVLQELGLEEREERSPLGSPKSPTSPVSPRSLASPGGSPRSSSPRNSPYGSMGSASPNSPNRGNASPSGRASVSPPAGDSPGRGTNSPGRGTNSPRGKPNRGKLTAASAAKALKNFGSVKRMLQELDDGDFGGGRKSFAGSPVSPSMAGMALSFNIGSPMSTTRKTRKNAPPPASSNVQMKGGIANRVLNHVRMPDGTHVSLADIHANAAGSNVPSPSPGASPGRISSFFSPGRLTRRGSTNTLAGQETRRSSFGSAGQGQETMRSSARTSTAAFQRSSTRMSAVTQRSSARRMSGLRISTASDGNGGIAVPDGVGSERITYESGTDFDGCASPGGLSPGGTRTRTGAFSVDTALEEPVGCCARFRRRLCCCCRDKPKARHSNKVSFASRKSREIMTLEGMDLNSFTKKGIDITQSPALLYDKLPRPRREYTCTRLYKDFRLAVRICAWVCVGQWKRDVNIKPLHIRYRARDLSRDAWRKTLDHTDYVVTERSTARTIAACTLWLPAAAIFWALCLYCNSPPMKHHDDFLDTVQHKLEEYLDRGRSHAEALLMLKRYLAQKTDSRQRIQWIRRCERVLRLLNMVLLGCLIIMSAMLNGDNAFIILPPLGLIISGCLLMRAAIEYFILPATVPSRVVEASTRQESTEEKKIRKDLQEIVDSDTSSETQDSSSEYSSANESFLDENPRSENLPFVLGVKASKVVVRPKALRLGMRYKLLKAKQTVQDHGKMWKRAEPFKYGRLLHLPRFLCDGGKDFRRGLRRHTVCFMPTAESDWASKADQISFKCKTPVSEDVAEEIRAFLAKARRAHPRHFGGPTEDDDWPVKFARFGFKRSHSLGSITARELPEWRAQHREFLTEAYFDISDEAAASHKPKLPMDQELPSRGLVDIFEQQGVFRQVTQDLSNAAMLGSNPFAETKFANKLVRVAKSVVGGEMETKPWDTSFDEEIGKYGGEGKAAIQLGAERRKRLKEQEKQRVKEQEKQREEDEYAKELARVKEEDESQAEDEEESASNSGPPSPRTPT